MMMQMDFEISKTARDNYIARRAEDLEACKTALATDDFNSIRKLAHKMKGNGSTFGFPELTKLGGVIEEAALASDKPSLEKLIQEFSKWVAANRD